MLYAFALSALPRAAWFGAALFVICGALRLARFNVQTGTVDKRFFVGLPTPPAAGAAVSTVILLDGIELSRWMLVAVAIGTYVVALLMVSTFRYWSFKEIDFARRRPLQTLLVVVLGVMIVATNHELFPFLLFVGYALSGPLWRLYAGRAPATVAGELGTKEQH
jgi:CDP-diacylglycerol--serine O-phosphatidyltransferase